MKFQMPDLEAMQKMADELDFKASPEQLQNILKWMEGFGDGYKALEEMPDYLPVPTTGARDWSYPADGENDLGAWYVRCNIEGAKSGPLAGRTVAVKDNIFVGGIPMMNGANVLEGFVPEYDATVVSRLLQAGATVTGKTVCEYLCVSGGSATASNGIVQNPVKRGHSAGGSSSGSAAVVGNGDADMALGCDQGGSVRMPASISGIYGMKATHGLVPYTGIMGMEESIDYCGPMTASVSDNALMLEVIAGYDGLDSRQRNVTTHKYTDGIDGGVTGMRIGVMSEGFGHPLGDTEVDECVRGAAERFRELGAVVEDVSIPAHLEGLAVWGAVISDGVWGTFANNTAMMNHTGPFSPALWEKMNGLQNKLDQMPLNAQVLLMLGKHLEQYKGYFYARGKNRVPYLRKAYDDALANYDLLLMPTVVQLPGKNPESLDTADDELIMSQAFNTVLNTGQFDATGHPAMSIPCGLREGLPVGAMLVARHFDEPPIYRAAYAFEQSGNWREF